MVFMRTKRSADTVSSALATRGFAAAAVHGDLGQGQRERAMRAFRTGKVDVLVATDVAARGLDVDEMTHVVNYECPEDEKAYLHRIGRTGRAGRTGVAVTFVDWADLARWKMISDTLSLGRPEPAETYSTSEHLYSDLKIPAGAKGTLPRAQRERAGLEAEELEDIGETGKNRSRRSQPDRGRTGPSGRRERGEHGPDGEPGQRRQRVRRRTRGGLQVAGDGPGAGEHAAASSDQGAQAGSRGPSGDAVATGDTGGDSAAPARRRRRRRSSRGRGGHSGPAAGSDSAE
jgi:superfamily II DNA/RNA helicase